MPAKKMLLSAVVVGSLGLLAVGSANADTITVQNQAQDVSGSVANGGFSKFQYLVTLDGQSYIGPGDGFVLYDWAGLVTSGPFAPSFQELSGPPGPPANVFNAFSVSQSLTSNTLTDSGGGDTAQNVANVGGLAAYTSNHLPGGAGAFDSSAINNITFDWTGALYQGSISGAATAILTIYSTIVGSDFSEVYGSADRSGTTPGTSYGQADGTVFVPNFAPVPATWMGGLALFGLVGMVEYRRRSRTA